MYGAASSTLSQKHKPANHNRPTGTIGNTIGNSIGNSIDKNPDFPDTPFYKYFDFFRIVYEKRQMPYSR